MQSEPRWDQPAESVHTGVVGRFGRFSCTPAGFRWFALADFVAAILITLSGAAVRLTGSGLGCPDWPTCAGHQITGPDGYHSVIEFGNRMITGALVIVTAAVMVAALVRTPRRRDLVALAGVLVAGIVANAMLGALVVYSKLNPVLVSTHMLLSIALVVAGANLYHRSKYLYGEGATRVVRDPSFRVLAAMLWVPFVVVIVAGTAATGSGPHAGGSMGQLVARRLPLSFQTASAMHAVAAMIFVTIVAVLLVTLWRRAVPDALKLGVRRLAAIGAAQAAIGFFQYATHVPIVLVELHVLGATSLAIGLTQFNLRQIARAREPGTRRAP